MLVEMARQPRKVNPMVDVIALQPSPMLDTLPELDMDGRSSIVVDSDGFTGWDDMFAREPAVDDYLLTPGDYRSWKACKVNGTNLAARRRVIRFIDSGRKPWDPAAGQAVVAGFEFLQGAAHWVVRGLTLCGPETSACYVRPGAEHITFDSMLIEDFGAYGVRLLGNHSTVQNCVIRRMAPDADGTAVQIRVRDTPNVGNRVLDNEIYDCNDAVSVTWNSRKGADHYVECRDLLVEGNDFYLTADRHVIHSGGAYALAENAVDIKAGPRSVTEPMKFINNRMWGFRRSVPATDGRSSDGAAVTIHRGAQRIHFEGNVIFDCPIGFHEVVRDRADPNQGDREVVLRSNIISLMCRYNTEDPGAVLRTRTSFRLEGNRMSHSHALSALPKIGPGDVYAANVLYDTPLGQAGTDWTVDTNRTADSSGMSDVLIMCRRWTGPDLMNLHSAVPTP
jgi:hypothetical protein